MARTSDARWASAIGYAEGALVAVADNYKKTNLLIGSKRRIAGLPPSSY